MPKKKSNIPITRTFNPEPKDKSSVEWIIWAAWADRITFEDIKKVSGLTEGDVIKIMRSSLKSSSFKLWRKRVHEKSIKNRKKFEYSRILLNDKSYKKDF
jgi:uncharacterized protein (TIGR03643 family)